MRLATVDTPEGPRLHVRGPDGYVDVAHATGEPALVDLPASSAPAPIVGISSGVQPINRAARSTSPSSGRRCPRPAGSCASE